MSDSSLKLRLRLKLGDIILLGPGKADLLDAIRAAGSISAAARVMGMSYKRAWDLVNDMNVHFHQPVVAASFGGTKGGGAQLTPFGEEVLACYRRILDTTLAANADDLAWLQARLGPADTRDH